MKEGKGNGSLGNAPLTPPTFNESDGEHHGNEYVTRFAFYRIMDRIESRFTSQESLATIRFNSIESKIKSQFKYVYWVLSVIAGAVLTPLAERLFYN